MFRLTQFFTGLVIAGALSAADPHVGTRKLNDSKTPNAPLGAPTIMKIEFLGHDKVGVHLHNAKR